jgi:hypothetical protein
MKPQRNISRCSAKKSAHKRQISYCPKFDGRLRIESVER